MKIYRPFKHTLLTQRFGENAPCVKFDDGRVVRPYIFGMSTNTGVCEVGYDKLYPTFGLQGHNGYDWKARHGEPVYYDCNLEGLVLETHVDASGGLGIIILTEENGRYFKHRYWHLKSFAVKPGDRVRMGRLLGRADNTGASSGDHLHRDMKECDKDGNTLNRNNGYLGAVPIEPYYIDRFTLEQLGLVYRLMGMFPLLIPLIKYLVWK